MDEAATASIVHLKMGPYGLKHNHADEWSHTGSMLPLSANNIPEFGSQAVLCVIAGFQDDLLDAGIQAFTGRGYRVSLEAGRSGW